MHHPRRFQIAGRLGLGKDAEVRRFPWNGEVWFHAIDELPSWLSSYGPRALKGNAGAQVVLRHRSVVRRTTKGMPSTSDQAKDWAWSGDNVMRKTG